MEWEGHTFGVRLPELTWHVGRGGVSESEREMHERRKKESVAKREAVLVEEVMKSMVGVTVRSKSCFHYQT